MWGHQVGCCVFAAAVFTLAVAFFLDVAAVCLVSAVDLGASFLRPVVFLVAVTLGLLGVSMTGSGEVF